MLSLEEILSPAPGILCHQVKDELVVVLPGQGRFIVLNKTGAQVFQMMDGSRTLGEIAAALSEQYGIPLERAQQDVLAFAKKLLERTAIIRKEAQDEPS
ncbi:MAG: PqqD family protein [Anaerolineae bacterium]|nr:PqqD family protein [Anaerolineae bacterium]MDW8103029.1 PqqD family protein [Anaerolineae bacterium]